MWLQSSMSQLQEYELVKCSMLCASIVFMCGRNTLFFHRVDTIVTLTVYSDLFGHPWYQKKSLINILYFKDQNISKLGTAMLYILSSRVSLYVGDILRGKLHV